MKPKCLIVSIIPPSEVRPWPAVPSPRDGCKYPSEASPPELVPRAWTPPGGKGREKGLAPSLDEPIDAHVVTPMSVARTESFI